MATFPEFRSTIFCYKNVVSPILELHNLVDGYQQRTTFGLNQDPKVWALTFNVKDSDADTIETFLENEAKNGTSFDWSPPDEVNFL